MPVNTHRLARGLARAFSIARMFCILGLVILVPLMLFSYVYPWAADRGAALGAGRDDLYLGATVTLFANAILLFAAVVLGKLSGMMRSVADRDPFTLENVARLRVIAIAMGAMVAFQAAAGVLQTKAEHVVRINAGHFDVSLFVSMLVVLVLAEVFREGVRLREESEGTI